MAWRLKTAFNIIIIVFSSVSLQLSPAPSCLYVRVTEGRGAESADNCGLGELPLQCSGHSAHPMPGKEFAWPV